MAKFTSHHEGCSAVIHREIHIHIVVLEQHANDTRMAYLTCNVEGCSTLILLCIDIDLVCVLEELADDFQMAYLTSLEEGCETTIIFGVPIHLAVFEQQVDNTVMASMTRRHEGRITIRMSSIHIGSIT